MSAITGMGAGLTALMAVYLIGLIKRGAVPRNAAADWSEKCLRPFYPAGAVLWNWYESVLKRRQKDSQREIRQRLRRLFVRDNVEEDYKRFQVKRFACAWLLAVMGLVVGIGTEAAQLCRSGREITNLDRPGAGESSRIYQLEAEGEWEGRMAAELSVNPREYTGQQLEQLFEETYMQALEQLPGENQSLDQVEVRLDFLESGPPGIRCRWTPERWEYIDHSGEIVAEDIPEEGIITYVTLELSYGTEQTEYQIPCRIVRSLLSEDDRLKGELAAALKEKETEDPYSEKISLPGSYGGIPLSFYPAEKNRNGLLIAGMGLLTAVLYCCGHTQKLKEREEERNRQMMADYPDILSKLTVLIGAGFTVRGAWEKIALNYSRQVEAGTGKRRFAYEEMLYACRGMQGGQPELQAYKNFGKRCGLQSYRKLTMLLEQNLKKGGRDLTARLRAETDEAFSTRLHQAKREGEKAGTKLMIPMFLMFILVLILIMVPAAMAF